MTNMLLGVTLAALVIIAALMVVFLVIRRRPDADFSYFKLLAESWQKNQERAETIIREEIARNREEAAVQAQRSREELSGSLELLRQAVERGLTEMQTDNAQKLEQMRSTVAEKLEGTLEKRLGESFRQVSERLEAVHQGLGDMRNLAAGVGDLKRVLTNVKTRGGWGEVQLGALLEEILAPEQFGRNVQTRENSQEVVEFAVRLPGQSEGGKESVWLPIDAKFPLEDYLRLAEAQDKADLEAVEKAAKMLETSVKTCARNISAKYINPPLTTDFAIMYLPTEGLYAEVAKRPALAEILRRDNRVIVAGPSTFAALLNSLQMGFRTLAIQKRSGEIWALLGAVKAEFGKFGGALEGVKKKLEQAQNSMEDAARKSRAIERKLRDIEELPDEKAQQLPPENRPSDNEPAGNEGEF
ncbi:MAG: DNA recombination protein RmuC [Deltaproteobacteria bacterium]|nr:DNA recombination protein RmuC [Deltaproteobacteria bacterium]